MTSAVRQEARLTPTVARDEHTPAGSVGWPHPYPAGYTGPHASVHSCPRQSCVLAASEWVEAVTGHPGEFHSFRNEISG